MLVFSLIHGHGHVELIYLLQFASYSVLDSVFEVSSWRINKYINNSTQDLFECNQANVRWGTQMLDSYENGFGYGHGHASYDASWDLIRISIKVTTDH